MTLDPSKIDDIKKELENTLKNNENLSHFNYEGSNINILLSVLEEAAQMELLNAKFRNRENRMSTAELRKNVVAGANDIGYTPHSKVAPVSYVNIYVENDLDEDAPIIQNLYLPRGSIINASNGNISSQFVTLESVDLELNFNTNRFELLNFPIYEGSIKEWKFYVSDSFEKTFEIPDDSIDTQTLTIFVKPNKNSSEKEVYLKSENITNITDEDKVYFLEENRNEKFQFYFGDDVFGYSPKVGSYVIAEYLSTPNLSNGAEQFSFSGTLSKTVDGIEYIFNNVIVETITKAYGGKEKQSKESIAFRANKFLGVQNRAVTPDDYKEILLRDWNRIDAINTWGGEDNVPPQYGRTFICIKPNGAEALKDEEKAFLKELLKRKNVSSIEPIFVDPQYTYIVADVTSVYNPQKTTLRDTDLANNITRTINAYNEDNLKSFKGILRHSELTRFIDATDNSIINSIVKLYMKKHFKPEKGITQEHILDFSSPLYSSYSNNSVLSSTAFWLNQQKLFIADRPDPINKDRRIIFTYRFVGDKRVTVQSNIGYMIPSEGRVVINTFDYDYFDVDDSIQLIGIPNSDDLKTNRNHLLIVDENEIKVKMVRDYGESGDDYSLVETHRR